MVHIPIFKSQTEATKIYIVCGRIALYWGPVEQSIESILVRLRNVVKYGIIPGSFKWSIPFKVSLSRKISEIKLLLKSSPKLANVQRGLLPIFARCKSVHNIRTTVVHSVCQGTNLKGKIMFDLPDRNKTPADHQKPQAQYSVKELDNTALEMLHLTEKLNPTLDQLTNPALR